MNACRIINRFMHFKCRGTEKPYLHSEVFRQNVPNDEVDWSQPFQGYNPPDYTSDSLNGKPWADSADPKSCKFNAIDGNINRVSHICTYEIGVNGRPLNPFGRTGLCGRGVLGRWGPNHAADTIISRFKDGKLQFIGIQRRDTGEWAVPGGMVDSGETFSQTLIREFNEEVLGGDKESVDKLSDFWKIKSHELYKGYVDDPRNTDNAWMETVAVNFHDTSNVFDNIDLKAGDDAGKVRWITIEKELPLYASHERFIHLLLEHHNISLD